MPRASGEPPAPTLRASCQFCRRRKIKCSGEHPSCSACTSRAQECLYTFSSPMGRPRKRQLSSSLSNSSTTSSSEGTRTSEREFSPVPGLGQMDWDMLERSWAETQPGKVRSETGSSVRSSGASEWSGWSAISAGVESAAEAPRINFEVEKSGPTLETTDDADLAEGLSNVRLSRATSSSVRNGLPPFGGAGGTFAFPPRPEMADVGVLSLAFNATQTHCAPPEIFVAAPAIEPAEQAQLLGALLEWDAAEKLQTEHGRVASYPWFDAGGGGT